MLEPLRLIFSTFRSHEIHGTGTSCCSTFSAQTASSNRFQKHNFLHEHLCPRKSLFVFLTVRKKTGRPPSVDTSVGSLSHFAECAAISCGGLSDRKDPVQSFIINLRESSSHRRSLWSECTNNQTNKVFFGITKQAICGFEHFRPN